MWYLQKTRFTAYMLWAKEIRQELMRVNPDLGKYSSIL